MTAPFQEMERLQRLIARIIATSPAGVNLLLIGGFRYRLLDQSQRFSVDIDYHWSADLEAKQEELLQLCRRTVLGRVRRELGYDGSASPRQGPEAESPNARFLDLRFWNKAGAIEIPIEVTRILCVDPPIVRTAEGVVHATASDADLIESKVIAVLNRLYLQHRDLVDLFLFGDKLRADSAARLKRKLKTLKLGADAVAGRLKDLEAHPAYHGRAIEKVLEEQVNPIAVRQIQAGGGGRVVLEAALKLLRKVVSA